MFVNSETVFLSGNFGLDQVYNVDRFIICSLMTFIKLKDDEVEKCYKKDRKQLCFVNLMSIINIFVFIDNL